MKYTIGVLGLLLVSSCVWAEPETMTMYSTLSAPIGSFWQVETKTCETVVMPAQSQLNLGSVATDGSVGSSGGNISVQGTKPISITKLRMEKGTKLQVSSNARWMVSTLKIAPSATFTLNGDLIANKLTLKNIANNSTVNATVLRLGKNLTVTSKAEITGSIQTGSCGNGDFCLTPDSSAPTTATWIRVACSKNENNNCYPDTYWLVGAN